MTDIQVIREIAEKVYLACCRRTFLTTWMGGGQSISYRTPNPDTHRWTCVDGGEYAKEAGVSRAIANRHLRALANEDGEWVEEKRDNPQHPLRFRPDFAYHKKVGTGVIHEMAANGMEFADVTRARSAKAHESRKGFVSPKWLTHAGDREPEHADGPVDVEFRDGEVASYPDGQSLGGWVHEGQPHDVMLWRPRPDRCFAAGVPA